VTQSFTYAIAVSIPVPRKFQVNDELVFDAATLPPTLQSFDQKFQREFHLLLSFFIHLIFLSFFRFSSLSFVSSSS
jgi:hypothetical protein